MGKRCLVALDTDHIKQYVFATDKLKEIRGASSILDHLNRREMRDLAREYQARPVYMNGGSGLFLIEAGREQAEAFGRRIRQKYDEQTRGGASITYTVQDIPDSVVDAWNDAMPATLDLLRFGLDQQKSGPPDHIALASHPFLHVCDACGSRYAETHDKDERGDPQASRRRYCFACMGKREEDSRIKDGIYALVSERRRTGTVQPGDGHPFVWQKVLRQLDNEYDIPVKTDRPEDFDALRGSGDGKDYLALIYADGNNMGQTMSRLTSLADIHNLAAIIDNAVYAALARAISLHLRVPEAQQPVFPFDILMIGGDDIMIVTSASVALDVACDLAKTFYEETKQHSPDGTGYSLSVGVVLAPVKYPFGPLHDLAQSTLSFAKKERARRQGHQRAAGVRASDDYGDSLINFITVTGSTSPSFKDVYDGLHARQVPYAGSQRALYATLRPYTVEGMEELLRKIRKGKYKRLGRTKLHQIREAVLRMNLSTSIFEGMAVLRNWSSGSQRSFVLQEVYPLGSRQDQPAPAPGMFQRVTFPWVADGANAFRTALLDYVELYDYVSLEKKHLDEFKREGEDDEA